jgi:hypothetical protein
LNAASGIGNAIFSAAGEAVNLVDLGLDSGVGSSRILSNTKVGQESRARVKGTREFLKNTATTAASKTYSAVKEKGLIGATGDAIGSSASKTGNFLHKAYIEGDLEAGAQVTGGLFTAAVPATAAAKVLRKGGGNTKLVGESDGKVTVNQGGCPCCFAGGTLVTTKAGLKPIEDIEEGEFVASKDDATGEVAWKPVTAKFVNDDDRLTYRLIVANESGEQEDYEVTDNHPFNVVGRGWVDSIDLDAGMTIPSHMGGVLTVVGITPLNRSPVTYNFEVGDFHTYFVGQHGAWVHNTCACDIGGKTRKQALKEAKDRAGIPRSQQSDRQWQVGDDINKKGGDYKNYEYSDKPGSHGRYYEYTDANEHKKVVVDHNKDPNPDKLRPDGSIQKHAHAGEAKPGHDPRNLDFKDPDVRYQNIETGKDHHIDYDD